VKLKPQVLIGNILATQQKANEGEHYPAPNWYGHILFTFDEANIHQVAFCFFGTHGILVLTLQLAEGTLIYHVFA
jgi:hypothetical protein